MIFVSNERAIFWTNRNQFIWNSNLSRLLYWFITLYFFSFYFSNHPRPEQLRNTGIQNFGLKYKIFWNISDGILFLKAKAQWSKHSYLVSPGVGVFAVIYHYRPAFFTGVVRVMECLLTEGSLPIPWPYNWGQGSRSPLLTSLQQVGLCNIVQIVTIGAFILGQTNLSLRF